MRQQRPKNFRPTNRDAFLRENMEETEEMIAEQFGKYTNGDKRNNNMTISQISKSGYFAQDNVKGYEQELATHLFGKDKPQKVGRGSFFNSVEELEEWIGSYIQVCMKYEIVPTISGLATWLRCSRDTLYAHGSNPNSPFYETVRSIIDFCHTCLETGASESKLNSVAYIFQAKNYFGLKDATEVQVSAATDTELSSPETLNALKEQIQQEKDAPKQIDMREATIVEEKIAETVKVEN